jgi:hypothetical protein
LGPHLRGRGSRVMRLVALLFFMLIIFAFARATGFIDLSI